VPEAARTEAVERAERGERVSHATAKEIVASYRPREILAAAKEVRAETIETRRVERNDRIREIATGNRPLDVAIRYPVIYADPPWRYENPPMGATNRAIENHYPTMDLAEICALPLRDLATDDAILFLWATAPKLAECMAVVTAWGFVYRTCMVWVKDQIGMGYHARNQHEILLIGKRGEIPPPAPENRPSSVLHAPRGEHSAKPDAFHGLIERMYPDLPRIELFARAARPGWAAWGNQANAA
jgi:N6-adenosine-specific RNA methylase IME4